MEYKPTYYDGLLCNEEGEFIYKNKPKKSKKYRHGVQICFGGSKGRKYLLASKLVASAWCDNYYDGCYVTYKDGDKFNIKASNLNIADGNEFLKYCGRQISKGKMKSLKKEKTFPNIYSKAKWEQYGEFRPTGVEGFQCTVDGVFRRNMKIAKVYYLHKRCKKDRAILTIYKNGKNINYNAAKLVAKAWSPHIYFEDCYIDFVDGDKHNIHNDNLILLNEKEFIEKNKPKMKSALTFLESKNISKMIYTEQGIYLRHFETESFDEINKYVQDCLIPYISKLSVTNRLPKKERENIVNEAIVHLYCRIDAKRPIYSFTHFTERLIKIYAKQRNFGLVDIYPPKRIEKIVNNFNYNCLCEKFKVKKNKF